MVYPVNEVSFKIGPSSGSDSDMNIVKDMETFGIAFDNGVEEWNPLDQSGWVRRLMTAKSITISLSGKRNYGDPGNDYVASLAYVNGNDATANLSVTFPDASTLTMSCVVNVTACDGGDSTAVAALEFECMSDGEPVYAAASEI